MPRRSWPPARRHPLPQSAAGQTSQGWPAPPAAYNCSMNEPPFQDGLTCRCVQRHCYSGTAWCQPVVTIGDRCGWCGWYKNSCGRQGPSRGAHLLVLDLLVPRRVVAELERGRLRRRACRRRCRCCGGPCCLRALLCRRRFLPQGLQPRLALRRALHGCSRRHGCRCCCCSCDQPFSAVLGALSGRLCQGVAGAEGRTVLQCLFSRQRNCSDSVKVGVRNGFPSRTPRSRLLAVTVPSPLCRVTSANALVVARLHK